MKLEIPEKGKYIKIAKKLYLCNCQYPTKEGWDYKLFIAALYRYEDGLLDIWGSGDTLEEVISDSFFNLWESFLESFSPELIKDCNIFELIDHSINGTQFADPCGTFKAYNPNPYEGDYCSMSIHFHEEDNLCIPAFI